MRLLPFLLLPAIAWGQAAPSSARQASPKSDAAKPVTPQAATADKAGETAGPSTDEEKTVYAIGLAVYQSLTQLDLSPGEVELVKKAIADAAAGKPAVDVSEWGPKIQGLAQARAGRVAERQKATSRAYLEKAAAEPGAVKTPSGLIYRELTAGSGASPTAADTVKVHYRGTLVDGTEFDSSYSRNQPAQFKLNAVIPCWTEGVQKMKAGGKAQLVCPSGIAYGDSGRPSIPGGATLIFEVELLEILPATP